MENLKLYSSVNAVLSEVESMVSKLRHWNIRKEAFGFSKTNWRIQWPKSWYWTMCMMPHI